MRGQLDLTGRETTEADELTPRQRAVFELVCSTPGGIAADEAGAVAHSMKERPHPADERCLYCGDDGRQILETLRGKGLVRWRRNPRGGRLYIPARARDAVDRLAPELKDIPF